MSNASPAGQGRSRAILYIRDPTTSARKSGGSEKPSVFHLTAWDYLFALIDTTRLRSTDYRLLVVFCNGLVEWNYFFFEISFHFLHRFILSCGGFVLKSHGKCSGYRIALPRHGTKKRRTTRQLNDKAKIQIMYPVRLITLEQRKDKREEKESLVRT